MSGQLLAGAIGLWLHSAYFSQSMRETAIDAEWARLDAAIEESVGAISADGLNSDQIRTVEYSRGAAAKLQTRALTDNNELRPVGTLNIPHSTETRQPWRILETGESDAVTTRWIVETDRGRSIAVGKRQADGNYLILTSPLEAVLSQVTSAARQSVPIAVLSAIWMAAIVGIVSYLTLAKQQDGLSRKELESAKATQKQTQQYVRARDAIIFALAKLADSRDPETGEHLERIVRYSGMLASAARQHPKFARDISIAEVRLIQLSSALHDIGKVGIDDRVLQKRGPLTPDEMEEMKRHTIIAGECLGKIAQRAGDSGLLKMARDVALSHHERWDGEGYPQGLRGTEIPLAARIVAIVDVYDALSSLRVYKAPLPHDKCLEIIREGAGTHFDPDLVAVWLGIEQRFAAISQAHAFVQAETQPHDSVIAKQSTPLTDSGFLPIPADADARVASTHEVMVDELFESR